MIASLLSKFENQRVDRERGAGAGVDRRHRAVSLGAQHVPHLHGFDDGERRDLLNFCKIRQSYAGTTTGRARD